MPPGAGRSAVAVRDGTDRGRRPGLGRGRPRRAVHPRHRASGPDRDARASATPTSTRSTVGWPGFAASCTTRAGWRRISEIIADVRRRPPRGRLDPGRGLVDGRLPRRRAEPGRPRSRLAGPAGLPDQPGRPQRVGQHEGARDRRDHGTDPGTRRRPVRSRAGRDPGRRCPGGRAVAHRAVRAGHDRRRAGRGARPRPAVPPLAGDHHLAGRDRLAGDRGTRVRDPGRSRRADGQGRRRAVVGAQPGRRADRRARGSTGGDGRRSLPADEREADDGRRPRELHRHVARSVPGRRTARRPTTAGSA